MYVSSREGGPLEDGSFKDYSLKLTEMQIAKLASQVDTVGRQHWKNQRAILWKNELCSFQIPVLERHPLLSGHIQDTCSRNRRTVRIRKEACRAN
jgi:hypothetical protein